MKRLKLILKKIFFLPPAAIIIIAVPSFAFVAAVLSTGNQSIAAYSAYVLSAYAAAIVTIGVIRLVRLARRRKDDNPIINKIKSVPAGERFLSDRVFRSEIYLYAGLAANLLYAALNLYLGLRYWSLWYLMLAFYYVLLCANRGFLAGRMRRQQDIISELRSYRTCGIILLIMNQVLTGIAIFIVNHDRGANYSGNLIYVMAAYTFYITISAIVKAIKCRKGASPTMSAAKIISLTAALVSMLSLETAMLAQFGGGELEFRRVMTSISAGVVCALVLLMAVYMIVRSTKRLRMLCNTDRASQGL